MASWRSMTKIAGSGSISQRQGSADLDPDPHQNVMDPQQWLLKKFIIIQLFVFGFHKSKPDGPQETGWLAGLVLLIFTCLSTSRVIAVYQVGSCPPPPSPPPSALRNMWQRIKSFVLSFKFYVYIHDMEKTIFLLIDNIRTPPPLLSSVPNPDP